MSGTKMRNIGPKSAAWLRQVGLRTHEDVAAIGTVEAFMRVKRAGFKPTLNLLYAIEGALLDCHWQEIPDERRQELILAAEAATALLPAPRNKPAAAPVRTTVHNEDRHEDSGFGGFGAGREEGGHGGDGDGAGDERDDDGATGDNGRDEDGRHD
ncbi:TfoX C- domain superfamily [Lysobacter enzymogenes]|uniref:TfoX C-domain superfamily n=1 Tax=Lysobacter enzymogenes TaxID=69 RepID=A0A0S2DC35_LYSEN|nr:TfoX/Sxy family protein [Lysobacter enzymogenes]ALN56074.1 TfoX C- domain superfamily [Lysobacter enzymogenes]QCW25004.1 TfoX/Sxy family protein [Lysobacter enzymogenes]